MNGLDPDRLNAYVREVLEGAPPLTDATRDALRVLLLPGVAAAGSRAA